MANTNPQAIRVSNERFRSLADRLAQLYHYARAVQAQIKAEGIDSLFAANSDALADGSETDGRTPLTNDDIKQFIGYVDDVVKFFDENSERRDLLLRVAVNPERS